MNPERLWRYDLHSLEDTLCPISRAGCPGVRSQAVGGRRQLMSDPRFRTMTVGKQDPRLSRPMEGCNFETDRASRSQSRTTTTIPVLKVSNDFLVIKLKN